jgi:hypothetical protein
VSVARRSWSNLTNVCKSVNPSRIDFHSNLSGRKVGCEHDTECAGFVPTSLLKEHSSVDHVRPRHPECGYD